MSEFFAGIVVGILMSLIFLIDPSNNPSSEEVCIQDVRHYMVRDVDHDRDVIMIRLVSLDEPC